MSRRATNWFLALVIAPMSIVNCSAASSVDEPLPPPEVPTAPPASVGHALIYHQRLGAVLLVNAGLGGMTSPPSSTKTILWRWTGDMWTILDADGPPVRNIGGVAYDAERAAVVLYGGSYSQNLSYDETWTWTQSGGWRKHDVSGPGKRDHTQMAYDAARKRVVLFGGQLGITSFPADTWLWDGSTWTPMSVAGPGARIHHATAFDQATGNVIVFGGVSPAPQNLGDTWAWNGTAWSQVTSPMSPRSHASLAPTSRGIVLIGGFPAQSSVMRLENGAWQTDNQPGNPGRRYMAATAYDPVRQVTVLYGGGDPSSDQLFAATWEYSASVGWRKVR